MTTALAVLYVALFQGAAIPAVVRVYRRKSARDLSLWREWMVFAGCAVQFVVMARTGAAWQVMISPLVSLGTLGVLLAATYRYR